MSVFSVIWVSDDWSTLERKWTEIQIPVTIYSLHKEVSACENDMLLIPGEICQRKFSILMYQSRVLLNFVSTQKKKFKQHFDKEIIGQTSLEIVSLLTCV